MNARHIGDNFSSLLYNAVTSSVFLYKLPIREGGAWPLTPPPPPHSSHLPSTDFSADRQCLGGGGGLGSGEWAAPPPRHKLEGWPSVMEGEGWGWGSLTSHIPPHSSNLSSTDFSADRQCLGGGGGEGLGSGGWAAPPPRHKLEGWPWVMEGEGWGWGGWGLGGRWHHAPMLHGSGEVNLYIDYEAFKQWH